MQDIQSFLNPASPRLRALGGGRFDQHQAPSPEWAAFGSFLFMLPRCGVGWTTDILHLPEVEVHPEIMTVGITQPGWMHCEISGKEEGCSQGRVQDS